MPHSIDDTAEPAHLSELPPDAKLLLSHAFMHVWEATGNSKVARLAIRAALARGDVTAGATVLTTLDTNWVKSELRDIKIPTEFWAADPAIDWKVDCAECLTTIAHLSADPMTLFKASAIHLNVAEVLAHWPLRDPSVLDIGVVEASADHCPRGIEAVKSNCSSAASNTERIKPAESKILAALKAAGINLSEFSRDDVSTIQGKLRPYLPDKSKEAISKSLHRLMKSLEQK